MKVSRETLLCLAAVLLAPSTALADPQWNAALLPGIAWVRTGDQTSRPLYLGGQADVMFGRTSNASWGLGPVARVGTYNFGDLQLQLGGSLLLPVHDYLPFVVSAGMYGARGDDRSHGGGFASLYWGTRSYNHHGSYIMTGGILVEGRRTAGEGGEKTFLIAANVDAQAFSLPFMMLVNAFR